VRDWLSAETQIALLVYAESEGPVKGEERTGFVTVRVTSGDPDLDIETLKTLN
jgi:hypothetical protein